MSEDKPVAWFCFVPAPAGEDEPLRIRAWTTDADRAKSLGEVIGREFQPLYAAPAAIPGLVKALEEIAYADEFFDAGLAKQMMNIARAALASYQSAKP